MIKIAIVEDHHLVRHGFIETGPRLRDGELGHDQPAAAGYLKAWTPGLRPG